MADIKNIRNEIDAVDKEMAKLFIKRMDLSKEVALYKQSVGAKIEDKQREEEILAKNSLLIENDEYKPYYADFLNSNMRISKRYQKRILSGMTVAVSGTKGAFAYITAGKIFGETVSSPFADFNSAYLAAQSGECDLAFLPLENSFGGDVGAVLDLLYFGNLYINGIYEAEITQNLIAKNKTKENDIKTVLSHPQALAQCGAFIEQNGFKTIETANTTEAVKAVAKSDDLTLAAIGSFEAAKELGLKVVRENINEQRNNTTRFVLLSRTKKKPSAFDDRFVLMFTVKDTAGALSGAISVIGEYGFNLVSIKSRPTREENHKHYFYVEGEGNIGTNSGEKMTEELKKCCDNLKIMGSFQNEKRV